MVFQLWVGEQLVEGAVTEVRRPGRIYVAQADLIAGIPI